MKHKAAKPSSEDLEIKRLLAGEHSEPHRLLGMHPHKHNGQDGVVVRALHPEAVGVDLIQPAHDPIPLESRGEGVVFTLFLPGAQPPLNYRLRYRFSTGHVWEQEDPYRFLPTLGDTDLHLFNEGNHRRLWECMGAHVRTIDGVEGVSFAVWAPNARRVSVVGDFCGWDGRRYPMRQMGSSGVFELFIPGLQSGELYKYEIKTQTGEIRIKTDPFAFSMEHPPGTASRVYHSTHEWGDAEWMESRRTRDWTREPIAIYELHLGSWARHEDGGVLNYRELAPRLVEHVKRFGFTHIEPLPLAEHPFDGSWGYQVSGYYAPTARYGTPDDFRCFVDYCHQHGIGVIVDWVPAHFPRDDFALRRFDGTALYEHEDPRRGEHPDWGTLLFNYGRNEVRNFLIANALYWLTELHLDGLRVDAVASMLYLDYSRNQGEWVPNKYGGREDLEAIHFIQSLNETIRREAPGAIMVAEESTAWGGVSRPVEEGGLGFTFKWNMGWMHDTLLYFSKEPVHRKFHHNDITFAMIYEYTERFIMPLSHDEVVHGKGALLSKMPGDLWQQFANLRTLLAYQYTRPGKVLLFMGTELAPWYEWYYDVSLDWNLSQNPERAALQRFMDDLGTLYRETPCLWRSDPDPNGCWWIDCHDSDNSVLSYFRRDTKALCGTGLQPVSSADTLLPQSSPQVENLSHTDEYAVIVLNLTPVPRDDYRVGVPVAGRYVERLNSDDPRYHGSGYATFKEVYSDPIPWQGFQQSLRLNLPPLTALVLTPAA